MSNLYVKEIEYELKALILENLTLGQDLGWLKFMKKNKGSGVKMALERIRVICQDRPKPYWMDSQMEFE